MTGDPIPTPQPDTRLHPVFERITGHSVDFELLFSSVCGAEGECCGGYLVVGTARLWLSPDQANNLARRVRAAIDHAILSNFPSPLNQRSLS